MSQLGERLREARERQGLTLAQIAADTRILQRYLMAIEDGEYHLLPGDVYARGFLRNYARYLGLPVEELIEIYRRERGFSDPIRVVAVTSAPRIRSLFIPSFFGVFFVVLALVGLSYLALSTTNRIGESAQAPTALPTDSATPPPLPTALANQTTVALLATAAPANPTATEGAGGVVAATPAPTAAVPISGEIRVGAASARGSWLNILVDGQSVFQGTLKPNTSRAFTAQRRVEVRIGNASAVSVVVNGKEFAGLGGDGQPVTFRWPQ